MSDNSNKPTILKGLAQMRNSGPSQPKPAGTPIAPKKVAPAKEIDSPLNSMMLLKSKPMPLDEQGRHPFQILREKQQVRSEFISGLFFGLSGTGKTSILGSAAFDPRTSPVIILSADKSHKSLRGIPEDKLSVVTIDNFEDLTAAWDYLYFQKHPYKMVGIDGLTDLHIYSLLTIMEYSTDNSKEGRREDPTASERSDFGHSMQQMRRILISFSRLRMHLFFTAQPKTANIPRMGNVQVPSLFGQMSQEVAGAFDICAYVSNTDLENSAPTQPLKPGEAAKRYVYLRDTDRLLVKVRSDFGEVCPQRVMVSQKGAMTEILNAVGL